MRSQNPTPISLELPPRARRIQISVKQLAESLGTTSACAENTGYLPHLAVDNRNYLRVRGEYDWDVDLAGFREELPPRARRILQRLREER